MARMQRLGMSVSGVLLLLLLAYVPCDPDPRANHSPGSTHLWGQVSRPTEGDDEGSLCSPLTAVVFTVLPGLEALSCPRPQRPGLRRMCSHT